MKAYPELSHRVTMVLSSKETIYCELIQAHNTTYRQQAETLVPELQNCRHADPAKWLGITNIALASTLGLGLVIVPNLLFLAIILWACTALLSNNLLKVIVTLSM